MTERTLSPETSRCPTGSDSPDRSVVFARWRPHVPHLVDHAREHCANAAESIDRDAVLDADSSAPEEHT